MSKLQTKLEGWTGFWRFQGIWPPNLAQTDEPSMHDISVLQGLLNFAGGFVAGRAFKPILHFVQKIIRSKDFSALKRLHGYINEVVRVSACQTRA